MKYVAPNKDLKAFTCPHCHTLAQMERDVHHFRSDAKVVMRLPFQVTGLSNSANNFCMRESTKL